MRPDFETAINQHFHAIINRDIEHFISHLTNKDKMYTIVQNGFAFTSPSEVVENHREWFKNPDWIWEGELIHSVVGEDVGMALVKYKYRTKMEETPVVSWLTYVLRLEQGQWRIVHDQSTSLDFGAFARMAGIEI